jgi:hypothetical protein
MSRRWRFAARLVLADGRTIGIFENSPSMANGLKPTNHKADAAAHGQSVDSPAARTGAGPTRA